MESEQRQPRYRREHNESESRMRAFEAGISDGNGSVVIAMTASSDTPNLIQRCEPSSASLEGCATICGHPSRRAKRAPQDDD
jgi:hypothetical protein